MHPFRVRHLRTIHELDDYEKIWKSFESVDGGPSIFQSWAWNRGWCEHVLCKLKRARLDVQIIEDEKKNILAILPFFETALAGGAVRLIQFIGHRMSYHNDILLADPNSPELADGLIRLLIDDLGYRTVIHLRHLREESVFTKQLFSMGLAKQMCQRLQIHADPTIMDQSVRFGRSTRKRFRGQANKLWREFDGEFCVRSGGSGFLHAFDELVDLHQRRFDSMNRSTLLVGQNFVFLKAATTQLCHTGNFEIVQLRAGDRTIAAALMARDKHHYFCVQTGFDPEFSSFSPMRILLTETMRRGFDDLGCKIYDLGPGYESYKFDWKPNISNNFFCCIGGRGFYAKSMAALYRIAFQRILPKTLRP